MAEEDWQSNYELGKKAFEEKRYDNAMQYLEKVAAQKKSFADVFNMLGLIYYYNTRFEDAITAFEKSLEINPNYVESSLNLAVIFNELGKFEKSRELYFKAKESRQDENVSYLDPYVKGKLANMHAELGTIYKDLGLYHEACEEYKKALSLGSGFIDVKINLGTVYRDLKDYDKAVSELEEATQISPESASSRTQLGLTYYIMGKYEKAKSEWLKVLRKDPKDKIAQMYMNLLLTPSR